MSRKSKLLAGFVGFALVAWSIWVLLPKEHTTVTSSLQRSAGSGSNPQSNIRPVQAGVSLQKLDLIHAELLAAKDPGTVRRKMSESRLALASMPSSEAAAAIRKFLDTKADAPTQQSFKISGTGLLDEAPTLRTFLLDELGRLNPATAADYAKIVLSSKDSPDEWAVALRNLARGDASAEGRALLEQKTNELLRQESWQQNPSVGFLEAFDVAVYVGGTNLMPALSDLVRRQDNPAVAHAAFLALDKLVINQPAATLAALQASPDLMEGREQTRANCFARADVRDPQQRQVVEKYLLDPQIGPAEMETFAGIYPNANFMISHNLLTQNPTPDHATLVIRDAESLRVVQEWLEDPRFTKVRPELGKMKSRLEEFTRQAAAR